MVGNTPCGAGRRGLRAGVRADRFARYAVMINSGDLLCSHPAGGGH
jgi:hypothetical protein